MVMDTDVIVVGAGPTGLMLAGELCRAGVRPLVLERHPAFRDIPKAGGLNGRIVELVRYRGLLERFEAAGTAPIPAPQLPFGGIHLDFTGLADPPMELLMLPQPQLERLLAEIAGELGAEIRRGQELVGLSQDEGSVTAEVRGPEGTHEVTARYLVGCDGASSPVRDIADISFPGTTFPEIQRDRSDHHSRVGHRAREPRPRGCGGGQDPVRVHPNRARRLRHGVSRPFAPGRVHQRAGVGRVRRRRADDGDRGAGQHPPRARRGSAAGRADPADPLQLSRPARRAIPRRAGAAAGDAAHLFPAGGVALNAGMVDSVNLGWKLAAEIQGWAPPGLLDTYSDERRLAAERTLLHARAQWAMRRGHDAAADALRELFLELVTDEPALRRIGALIAGTDVRYPSQTPTTIR